MREQAMVEIVREQDLVQRWIAEAVCTAALHTETADHDEHNLARAELEIQAWEDQDGGEGNIENIGGGERDLSKAADRVGQVETKVACVSREVPPTKERD